LFDTGSIFIVMAKPRGERPRTGPRYEPRAMLINPREFGRRLYPEFVEETNENVTQVSGAMVQHMFAKGIRDALMDRGMSVVTLSEMTGLNYQRLTRMLRGSVLMRMDDVGMIARAVPEAFDWVVGRYDPRDRFMSEKKSRLAQIYEAARPLGSSSIGEPRRRTPGQSTD
jgi:hypothetical protein